MPQKLRNYKAEYARRIARGVSKGLSRSQARGHPKVGENPISPRTSVKPIEDARFQRALTVLRKEKNLAAAARAAGVSVERFRYYATTNRVIEKHGRYWQPAHKLPRPLPIFSRGQRLTITVPNFAASSLVGKYNSAVGKFIRTNNPMCLAPFRGVTVTDIMGKSHPFETRPNVIYRLEQAGGPSYPEIYRIIY